MTLKRAERNYILDKQSVIDIHPLIINQKKRYQNFNNVAKLCLLDILSNT